VHPPGQSREDELQLHSPHAAIMIILLGAPVPALAQTAPVEVLRVDVFAFVLREQDRHDIFGPRQVPDGNASPHRQYTRRLPCRHA